MELIDQNQLQERLNVSRPTLIKWRKKGLPNITVGRIVRFEFSKVIEWMSKNNDDKKN